MINAKHPTTHILLGYELPKVYGGCSCDCHRNPHVYHVMACCTPTQEELQNESKQLLQEESAGKPIC